MAKNERNILKQSLQIAGDTIQTSGSSLLYKNYRYTLDSIIDCKAIAKSENLHREQYELGLVGLIISNLRLIIENNIAFHTDGLIKAIIESNDFSEKEIEQLKYYIDFFDSDNRPKDIVEKVLLDCKYSHLGLINGFERMALMRIQVEATRGKKIDDLEWEQFCKDYFLNHNFYTKYAQEHYGNLRSKNFAEIERRIEKIQLEQSKGKKVAVENDLILSDKEGENLFKIAFRNYVNLVALADRKAHLLIEVNSILASVIIGFTIKRSDNDSNYYLLPTVLILLVAGFTIFYAILASKPLAEFKNDLPGKEPFFFGSFDRIDHNFKNVTWEKYFSDISQLFKGDKEYIFSELIRESFQVRKVLSKKFGYLSIAYKIFIVGQLSSIGIFLAFILLKK
ncbi:MAG: Pycsar system effector family protein [Ginsengibacter sp.]